MKIKLLVFDMDGLMFQTSNLAYRCYIESARKHDFSFNHEIFYYLSGRPEKEIIRLMKNLYGDDHDVVLWRKDMDQARNKIIQKEQRIYKKRGLVELLDYARSQGIKCVVASSNKRENINKYLKWENIRQNFSGCVSAEDVTEGKPNGEVFNKACLKMGVKNNEAIVLEDSNVGILAANHAQIFSIQIPDFLEDDLPEFEGSIGIKKENMKIENNESVANLKMKSLYEVVNFLKENS